MEVTTRAFQYQCLVDGCAQRFRSSGDRKEHLVRRHLYPADFRFDKPKKSSGCARGDTQRRALESDKLVGVETRGRRKGKRLLRVPSSAADAQTLPWGCRSGGLEPGEGFAALQGGIGVSLVSVPPVLWGRTPAAPAPPPPPGHQPHRLLPPAPAGLSRAARPPSHPPWFLAWWVT